MVADLITAEGAAGARFTVDPAVPWVAAQLANGALTPVTVPASEPGPPERPPQSAPKAAHVDYAVDVLGFPRGDAEKMTKADLVAFAEGG